jgi:predicted AlkP superfamily phosphohydrolase/phosphomutase
MVKLIMLGLDGCSPDQIYRHADELPNFNRVMNAGTHEINRSVVPPITPHTWTTIFSGK